MSAEGVALIVAIVALAWAILRDDLKAWTPRIAMKLIRIAARRLPAEFQERYEQEWIGELAEIPEGAIWSPIAFALGCFASVPGLREALSSKRKPRKATRVVRADHALLLAMRTRMHGPRLEPTIRKVVSAGNHGAIWIALAMSMAVIDPGNRSAWLAVVFLIPLSVLLNYFVKLIVRRRRPVLDGLPPLGYASSSLTFPCAHAVSSFTAAVAMTRITPFAGVLLVLAAIVSAGRPYLGMHYPSDVIAGALIGITLGLIFPLGIG